MTPKEHAILLLSQGISTAQVAAACGVSESYISQLRADPEVREQIHEKRAADTLEDIKFDSSLEAAENMALEKIQRGLPFANMGQAIAAFRILNAAKKRTGGPAEQQDSALSVTVNLTLPAAAATRYVVNAKNEIVEVEGKTMISATAKTLDGLLAEKAGDGQEVRKLGAVQRAATILDNLKTPKALIQQTPPRRSPLPLSTDML